MKTYTYAFAHRSDLKVVRTWCEKYEGDDEKTFQVINGGWELDLDKYPDVVLVWEGEVPNEFGGDYNTAIHWIDGQIRDAD